MARGKKNSPAFRATTSRGEKKRTVSAGRRTQRKMVRKGFLRISVLLE